MFDVLTYLFEQYSDPAAFGDRSALTRQLNAVGFDDDDIGEALDWLDSVGSTSVEAYAGADDGDGLRVYAASELEHLPADVRGLIRFLEDNGALTPSQREMVIDRLLELDSEELDVDNAKLLVLMVLWAQQAELPILLGEALLEAVHGEPTMQ
ncbi:hypothetical protein CXB49_19315 [Chromobacterium sp. ATCC 53434]|uniref:DUF494 family protein n=1 Tax=Chromobacterium TaxID=535 RepID=UPI000C791AD7|nr:DUF494 domain-containing protein [Chromobacterium sp. ATCC 53434]AUH52782.1 hypothetical protein CXB49_19315 [Chromobacterium sp. ATCC 53434]